jgi:adenylosuccinate synthase
MPHRKHAKGDTKIGSTLKGIGPTYRDKIGREGLRVGDITEIFSKKNTTHRKNNTLAYLRNCTNSTIRHNWKNSKKNGLMALKF